MLALGIICLLLAAALVLGVLLTGTSQEIVFTSTVGDVTTNPVWVFVAGALAMLLVLLGLSLFRRGTRRRIARRQEIKRLRKVEQERGDGPESGTRPDSDAGSTARDRYDEPDRRLVREPRAGTAGQDHATSDHATSDHAASGHATSGHAASGHAGRGDQAEYTDLSATETRASTTGDDAARHRDA